MPKSPIHDDVIKWKHLPRYWPFVRGIHRSPVNSPHKGQWRWADVFFYLRLTKRLSKQSWGWWFETLFLPLWRHRNHAVSANRILWVHAGFWWYHGILLVHLQDSVGAFGAKWLTKWLHHAKAPPRRGVLRWEWSNKDVHLVTTFVFCHVSKC